MPVGTVVHNVELQPGRGGQIGRSAGTAIQLMAKDGDMATLRLPSGEMRMVRAECRATVGTIGNADHQNVKIGKAGRKRHMGVRPQTRGTAMNPVDHPHGGGEGSTTAGRHPVTPWGKPTLGYRTRKKNKTSDRYIVRGRRRGQGQEVDQMSRSSKKGPLVEERLMTRIDAMNAENKKQMVKTWSRASTIFPEMVGHTIAVHDGRKHVPGVRQRVDGRAQARRVRADAHLPRPCRLGEGPLTMAETRRRPGARSTRRSTPSRRPPRRRCRGRRPSRPTRPPQASAEQARRAGAEARPTREAAGERRRREEAAAPQRRRKSRRARGGAGQAGPRARAGARCPVVRAQAKYVRTSARKARLVCDHIRGKSVIEARAILAHTPRAVAEDWEKLLESAVANAEHNHELLGDDLLHPQHHRRRGPDAQAFPPARHGPRVRGSASAPSHLTITLTPKE